MNEITLIEKECTAIGPKLTNAQVIAVYDRAQFYASEMKRIKALTEGLVMDWIRENGDLVVSDSVRYYIGTEKNTKCVDMKGACMAILDAVGGDFEAFGEILSSNAIKHGAAKKILPPATYDTLFRVEIRESLEEGKPKQKLIKVDDAFTGARKPWKPKPAAGTGGGSAGVSSVSTPPAAPNNTAPTGSGAGS
jgi:hypothetical protein